MRENDLCARSPKTLKTAYDEIIGYVIVIIRSKKFQVFPRFFPVFLHYRRTVDKYKFSVYFFNTVCLYRKNKRKWKETRSGWVNWRTLFSTYLNHLSCTLIILTQDPSGRRNCELTDRARAQITSCPKKILAIFSKCNESSNLAPGLILQWGRGTVISPHAHGVPSSPDIVGRFQRNGPHLREVLR